MYDAMGVVVVLSEVVCDVGSATVIYFSSGNGPAKTAFKNAAERQNIPVHFDIVLNLGRDVQSPPPFTPNELPTAFFKL